jgi:hypothetical protein
MAHDAASGYLSKSAPIRGEVVDWTKTQELPTNSMADLLNCGARSFDWRPAWHDGKLVGHHGDINVDHEFAESLAEIKGWADANPEELVMMHIWDCASDDDAIDCGAKVLEALASLELPAVTSCAPLVNVTLGEAKRMGKLSSGGTVLPVYADGGLCTAANYDESIACWGSQSPFFTLRAASGAADGAVSCIAARGIDEAESYASLGLAERVAVQECIDALPPADQEHLQALFTYASERGRAGASEASAGGRGER